MVRNIICMFFDIFYCNNIFDNLLHQLNVLMNEGFITKNLNNINTHIISDPDNMADTINHFFI